MRLGYEINLDAIPYTSGCTVEQALNDGEDYELLFFTVSPRIMIRHIYACPRLHPGLKLRDIGTLVADPKQRSLKVGGWDRFNRARSSLPPRPPSTGAVNSLPASSREM